MTEGMNLFHYFRPKEGLPHPNGLLSTSIPSQAIASANKEVQKCITASKEKNKKRGAYKRYIIPIYELNSTVILLIYDNGG